MQLKIQRSQRMGGMFAGTVVFCLDVRADYSAEERHNINKYRLGGEVIYNSQAARKHLERAGAHLDRTQNRGDLKDQLGGLAHGAFSMALAKMSLNISIASLGRGHHIECKDLNELLEAEDTVREACKNVTRFLQVAETFDGSEIVVEYENGEERVHITQPPQALIGRPTEALASDSVVTEAEFEEYEVAEPEFGDEASVAAGAPDDPFMELGRYVARLGSKLVEQWTIIWRKIAAFWATFRQKTVEFVAANGGSVLKQQAAEFVTSKGWGKLPSQAVEHVKQRWLTFEQKILTFAETKDWPFNAVHIRAVCAVTAFALVAAITVLAYELL